LGGVLLLAAGTAAPVWGQQVIVPPAPVLVTSPVVTVINATNHQTYDPHVSKDLVSYSDHPSDTIRYYRFSTGVDSAIPNAPGWRDILSDVSGNLIAFTRMSTTTAVDVIMLFNTATSVLMEIAPQVGSQRIGSALGGNTLAFADFFNLLTGDIMAYDLAANTLTNLSASPLSHDQNPSVSPDGNTIVWENCVSSLINCDIVKAVRNGGAWTVSSVANTPSPESNPDTDGTWIAYNSPRAGGLLGQDIYFQPVGGGTETQLALAGPQSNASLSQGVIAFENTNTSIGFRDVFVYVIATNALYQVSATEFVDEVFEDVSVLDNGDIRLVWTSDDGVNQDILATTFTPFVFPLQRTLYGVNSSDDGLSAINPTTGLIRFIGPLSQVPNRFTTPVAMAVRPADEKLFVWNNSRINAGTGATLDTGELLTVDTCSGLAKPVRSGTPPQGVLGALAFAPDGRLFGLADDLWQIDQATGVATKVGPSLGMRIFAADFTPDGLLYGVEGAFPTQRLVRIDTVTGALTIVATVSQDIGVIGSIVFNPATGQFLGSSDRQALPNGGILFDLDPTTGTVSNVRPMSGGFNAQGLGFAPTCITGPIADILAFFDDAATSGSLVGTGSGQSGTGRLGALRNMIQTAGEFLSQGDSAQACQQLKEALDRTDGNPNPPDFVSGAAAAQLATMLQALRTSLGCG
jgi:hypothetical protein